jgi:RHS repeat-associated protein
VQLPDGRTASYSYDPFGRRIRKQIGTETTYFLYADEGLIGEYDASGSFDKGYGWRPSGIWGTDPVFMVEDGKYSFYHNDHLGTPQKMTNMNGDIVWSATYTAFGSAVIGSASTVISNLRFPGQCWDEETGLNYNYYRNYNPFIGRYSESDPIGLGGGINTYAYVGGNPVGYRDQYGLLNPAAVVGAGIGTIIMPGVGTVAGAVVGTAIGIGIGWWIMEARSKGDGDQARPPDVKTERDCRRKCKPCPPNPPPFNHEGDAHGSARGFHTHQWQYHQAPDCTCRAQKVSW